MPKHRQALAILAFIALAVGCGGDGGTAPPSDDGSGGGTTTPDDALFRVIGLALRDPHVFSPVVMGCVDFTDVPATGLNTLIQEKLAENDGVGGLLNNLLIRFRPLDPTTPMGPIDVIQGADCTTFNTTCTLPPGAVVTSFTDANGGAVGTCLAPDPLHLRPYLPGLISPTGPCFATDKANMTLDVVGISFPLQEAQVAGTYQGDPTSTIANGMIVGFLSEAAAGGSILPAFLGALGGQSLASILRGSPASCATGDDRDTGPGGAPGWWVYFQFSATKVIEGS